MGTWMTILAAMTLGGCGGASSSASRKPAAAPAETPAVRELRAAADAVCACADDTCAQTELEKLLAREADLQNPVDQVGLDGEHDRAIDCYARKTGVPRAAELIPVMEHAADAVCACSDESCARAVVEKLRGQLHEKENAVFTTADQAALEKAGDRLQKCAEHLSAAPGAPPAR